MASTPRVEPLLQLQDFHLVNVEARSYRAVPADFKPPTFLPQLPHAGIIGVHHRACSTNGPDCSYSN